MAKEAEAYRAQSLLNIGVWLKKIRCAQNMDQVPKASPSWYVALLAYDSKTRQQDRHTHPRDLIHRHHWCIKWITPLIWYPLQLIYLNRCFEAIWYSNAHERWEILWKTRSLCYLGVVTMSNWGRHELNMTTRIHTNFITDKTSSQLRLWPGTRTRPRSKL